MQRFMVVGCNHATASPDDIAHARLPAARVDELLPALKDAVGAHELVYLSTCHRTEWYLIYEGELCSGRMCLAVADAVRRLTDGASELPPVGRCVAAQGIDAARHLFRVAAALDSLMIGESQVLGQVKQAFRDAQSVHCDGPLLHTFFEQSFRAAKRVRAETTTSRGAVSLVTLAKRTLQERMAADRRPVAILGAGEMAGLAAGLAAEIDPGRDIVVFNRSRGNGEALAGQVGGRYLPLGDFPGAGAGFSVVVAALSATEPVVTPGSAAGLAPVVVLDLGVPPNVDAACAGLPGVELVDQAALRDEAERNRAARADEVARAETIVEQQLRELSYEMMEHSLSPVARTLVAAFSELARRELERAGANGEPLTAESLEIAIESLSRKLVRLPLRGLREVAWQHSPAVLATFLSAVEQ